MFNMAKFNVYLAGRLVDSVSYSGNETSDDVKKSLVDHDGYNPSIKVVKARNVSRIYPQKYSNMEKVEAKLKKMAGF
jgi:hypothetical protein